MSLITNCIICRSRLNPEIDKMLNDHKPVRIIQEWMRGAGIEEKSIPFRNTFSKHKTQHLNVLSVKDRQEAQAILAERAQRIVPSTKDLAVLVRDQAVEKLVNGEISPSLTEGLRAQELIDKRAQRGSDQDFMVKIAVLLSGGPVGLLPAVLEGEFSEEREEDESEMRLLMAGNG